jgi:hypothetical protein
MPCNSGYHWRTQYMSFYVLKSRSVRCRPPFLQHCSKLSRWFSITGKVFCSGIAAISSLILCFSYLIVLGLETERLLSRNPHKKQSQAETAGESVGHGISPPREMTCCGNILRRTLTDVLAAWGVAPSCWNHTEEGSIPRRHNWFTEVA